MNNTYGSGFVRKIKAGVKHLKYTQEAKDYYVIIDLETQQMFVDKGYKIKVFNDIEIAKFTCSMYELNNAFVAKLEWQYEEEQ
jgi:hypothetical protein